MRIRSVLLCLVLFAAGMSFAQTLNQAGHITVSAAQPWELTEMHPAMKGNTAFRTAFGYLTLSGNYENAGSVFRIYEGHTEEVLKKEFPRTLNFSISPSGTFCAFHTSNDICLVNLGTHELNYFDGDPVFAVNDGGGLAYYDQKNGKIHFNSIAATVNEAVYKVIFFKNEALFITMKDILRIRNGVAEKIYSVEKGRVFDAAVTGDRLFISVKREKKKEFVFNSFSSGDLTDFRPEDEVHFPLASAYTKKEPAASQRVMPSALTNESIVDPLYYYSSNVYQPVGNTYDEMQEYSPGAIYPHPGVDLLGTYMQNVYSVKKGYVKAVLTTSAQYHWRIAISNVNTSGWSQGYMYAHLEQSSIPYAVGDSVNPGDMIGYLVNFPVNGFVHCHFARVKDQGADWMLGDWWTFDNPLVYMTNILDSIAPVFERTINNDEFAFRDPNGNYLQPDSLYGNVQVITKVYDQINASWHCDVNKLRYSISPLTSPTTMLLDTFAYEYSFYNDFYFTGGYYYGLLRTIYSRDQTCFTTADYNVRDFYHIITNSNGDDSISSIDSLQLFNTLSLPNSSYIFRVTASDPLGNSTRDSMIIQIKNGGNGIQEMQHSPQVIIYPNPASDQLNLQFNNFLNDPNVTVFDMLGRKVESFCASRKQMKVDISCWPPGVYNVVVSEGKVLRTIKVVKE